MRGYDYLQKKPANKYFDKGTRAIVLGDILDLQQSAAFKIAVLWLKRCIVFISVYGHSLPLPASLG